MKTKLMVGCLFLVLGLTGCMEVSNWRTVSGTGRIITEPRSVSNFNRVTVAGSGELVIKQGEEEGLTIEADENLLPLIQSEVANGHLWVGPRNVNIRPTRTIHYQLKLKNLNELNLSGSLTMETTQLKTTDLAIHVAGSGKVRIAKLEGKLLDIHVSGSGDIRVAGVVNEQKIQIAGSADHQAEALESNQATVEISGSGHAVLWVKNNLNAQISGSGEVGYYGNPQVNSHTAGSGRVRGLGSK